MGRPKALTPQLKAEICARIAEGETVRAICLDEHMPVPSTVYLELARDPEFSELYAQAREAQLIRMEDELLEIADDASNDWMAKRDPDTGDITGWMVNGDHIHRSKVRIDTRKWIMAKRAPKKYGERVQQDVAVTGGDAYGVVNMRSSRDLGLPQEPKSKD
jgi:hypothetical protein